MYDCKQFSRNRMIYVHWCAGADPYLLTRPIYACFSLHCFLWNLFGSSTLAMSRLLTWWHLAKFQCCSLSFFLSSCLGFCPGWLIVKHLSGQNCFCSKMFLRMLHTRMYAKSMQNYDLATWARMWKTLLLTACLGDISIL